MVSVGGISQDIGVLEKGRPLAEMLGDKSARSFSRHLGIDSTGQLLMHYPRRYATRGELTDISNIPVGEMATVVGEIVGVSSRFTKGRSGSILEVTITDGKSLMTLAFFNQAWRAKELTKGRRGLFSGKIGLFSGKLQLAHPDYELFDEVDEEAAKAWAELPIPVYPAAAALPSWKIQKAAAVVLEQMPLTELLPGAMLRDRGLLSLSEAIRNVHIPKRQSDWQAARDSLRFHEAMILQLGLLRRKEVAGSEETVVITKTRWAMEFEKHLDFDLTGGQQEVISEIERDLSSGHPMHRLLQGEVGSGKTLVALRSILMAAESGVQSALLAPTEVLAEQHYRSTIETLGPELTERVGVRLLRGSMPAAEKKRTLLDIASGKSLLVVGTHALLSEQVSFADLGLVVIDEQHRFGVEQRDRLRGKANRTPHLLTMTATPIPRTVAISVFGDLEISTLRELPRGRSPIETFVVPIKQAGLVSRVWQRVAEEIEKGRQAFVVCPRISGEEYEDSEMETEVPPAAAEEILDGLQRNPSLGTARLGLMHGRLATEEKAEAMRAFAAGEIDVLVATTVIEVGVNVPNASVMVILDADRFGLSQLHQLRGRVGRGSHAGLCLLVSDFEPGSAAEERLKALASTLDGFKLSELDLEIRGEGDVLGDSQSGKRTGLKLLRVTRDAKLIEEARELSAKMLSEGLDEELASRLEQLSAQALERS